jgi:hypothetical protein
VQAREDDRAAAEGRPVGIQIQHVAHSDPKCPTLLGARLNPAERAHADAWLAERRKRRQAQRASRRRNRR